MGEASDKRELMKKLQQRWDIGKNNIYTLDNVSFKENDLIQLEVVNHMGKTEFRNVYVVNMRLKPADIEQGNNPEIFIDLRDNEGNYSCNIMDYKLIVDESGTRKLVIKQKRSE